jgi:hypothetical protein
MENPVSAAIALDKPFTIYHTHTITAAILDEAAGAGRSLEIDVAIDANGHPYIGHPFSFYEHKGLPPPSNLPLEQVLQTLKDTDTYIVLDCKDVRAVPKIKQIVQTFGHNRCLFHAWVDALQFRPYPDSLPIEPHWVHEDIPFNAVKELAALTDVPLMLSCRGLTEERLEAEQTAIIQRILGLDTRGDNHFGTSAGRCSRL